MSLTKNESKFMHLVDKWFQSHYREGKSPYWWSKALVDYCAWPDNPDYIYFLKNGKLPKDLNLNYYQPFER